MPSAGRFFAVRVAELLNSAGLIVAMALVLSGCQSAPAPAPSSVVSAPSPGSLPSPPPSPAKGVVPVSFAQNEHREQDSNPVVTSDDPLVGARQLDAETLVAVTLRQNPSLQAMILAWQAAAQRYPQVVSLEDPMVMLALGPGTFGDPDHDVAWMVEGSQKIPLGGKRQVRGEQASAQAAAAHWDMHDAELRLTEAATLAFLDYSLVRRDLELNREALGLSTGFRASADDRYRNNLVTQQDVLQADLQISQLRQRQFELERMDRVAIARINALTHRPVDAPLPPPAPLAIDELALPSTESLQSIALSRRPDLMSLEAQIRADQLAVELAERDYCPDISVVGRYDAFWQRQDRNLAPMVGVNFNVPLDNDRRRAAVCEAQYRANQRRAEYEARLDEIRADIVSAWQHAEESRRLVALFNEKILPLAEQNLASAQANYTAGKIDFLRLIEAERQLVDSREKREVALADHHRRLAQLRRAIGGPLPVAAEPVPPPSATR